MTKLKAPLQLDQKIIINASPEKVWEVFNDQSLLDNIMSSATWLKMLTVSTITYDFPLITYYYLSEVGGLLMNLDCIAIFPGYNTLQPLV